VEKTIVLYYSRTGSNKYLAEKISETLTCDLEPIKPRVNIFPLMMLFQKAGLRIGNRRLRHKIIDYDRVILCGPVWMGQFICPLSDFISKYKTQINELYFITCCGTSYQEKNNKFGHEHVFTEVSKQFGNENLHCKAFPIPLVLANDNIKDSDLIMKTRLSDQNFSGEIESHFNKFMKIELLN
jgi:menaquinone-dependent protoporphyrinogen IX oxidase